jgi:hypothetical protein
MRMNTQAYTVIRFVLNSTKFCICTVVGLNGTLVEAKIRPWDTLNVRILASSSVPFRPTTMQMPNYALIEHKLITVYVCTKYLIVCIDEYNIFSSKTVLKMKKGAVGST